MKFWNDTVIVVPTKRPPPVISFLNYRAGDYDIIIVAGPDVYDAHRRFYRDATRIEVARGVHGMGPQIFESYRIAYAKGFDWMFRIDDDLAEKTFVHRNGEFPTLISVLNRARECVSATRTTLAGFMNGSNRHWMSGGYKRTYGLIHGGAQIAKTTAWPRKYIDPALPCFEDIYRSCAHRDEAGAVGRVCFIGFDKSKSVGTDKTSHNADKKSSITITERKRERAKQLVLDRWSDFVTCNGTRQIHGGRTEILNWRMKRHPDYRP